MCESVSCTMEDVEEKRARLEQGLQPRRCRALLLKTLLLGNADTPLLTLRVTVLSVKRCTTSHGRLEFK